MMFATRLARIVSLGNRSLELNDLNRNWLNFSDEDRSKIQLELLRTRWHEAASEIPYYENLVRLGRACRDFSSIAEFKAGVPILTREELGRQIHQFTRAKAPDFYFATAGSTGTPVRFGCWKGEGIDSAGLNQWVGRMSNGMRLGDRVALLWGHSHLLGTGWKGQWRHVVRKGKDRLMGYLRMDAYHMGKDDARRCYLMVKAFKPKVVIGYAAALDLWARHCTEAGMSLSDSGIQLCVACSEVFPKADSREKLSAFLGAPVVMEYGGVDFGVCAYEVAKTSRYHVFWNSHLIEADSNGALAVTNLTRRYLPLFRYQNGDECAGAEFDSSGVVTSFEGIRGRIHDVLTMPDGKAIHSMGIFHCIHQEPVAFIQLARRPGEITIRLVTPGLTPESQERIRKRLAELHPDLGKCRIEITSDVQTNRAGKRRWIIDE